MKFTIASALLACLSFAAAAGGSDGKKMHYIHWNKANPMFRLDNTDHIVEVNDGNLPWEHDQVNIICPVSKPNVGLPERHVIYSVSREEFDSCRITNPKPKIVAICNRPHRLMYFTITFRSFTPTPGGLEFRPGQDYYFISTSSQNDLHRRVGGGCSTHNMKMIFKVADNRGDDRPRSATRQVNAPRTKNLRRPPPSSSAPSSLSAIDDKYFAESSTTHRSVFRYNSKVPRMRGGEYIYYYHPRDLIELENNALQQQRHRNGGDDDEEWTNEALRYTSSATAAATGSSCLFASVVLSVLLICCSLSSFRG